MGNLTIGKRIYLLAGLLCITIAGLSVAAVLALRSIESGSAQVTDRAVPGLHAAAVILAGQQRAELLLARYLRTTAADAHAGIKRELDQIGADITAALDELKAAVAGSPEEQALFDRCVAARAKYRDVREQFYKLMETDPAAAGRFVETELRAAHDAYTASGNALFEHSQNLAKTRATSLRALVAKLSAGFLIAGAAIVAVGIGLSVLVVRRLIRALGEVVESVSTGSSQIASASAQVSATSQSLAQGASEQAASLEETGASLEEMASMTKRNAENAQQAKATARQTREAAELGGTQMERMQSAMQAIQTASHDIAKILKTIDEIAFQTNILALNAAVEAARAGESGAGFAVVADEVRALAQRCAAAARETATKIEESSGTSQQGVSISAEVARSFGTITTQVRQLDQLVAEIAQASSEQSQGIQQVTSAMSQVDKVTQANASNAEEAAAAAEEMNAQAAMLKDAVLHLQQLAGATRHADSPAPVSGSAYRTDPAPMKAGIGLARNGATRLSAPRVNGTNGVHRAPGVNGTNGRHAPVENDFFR